MKPRYRRHRQPFTWGPVVMMAILVALFSVGYGYADSWLKEQHISLFDLP